jgi:DNA-binding Xre family transcriptional regulator
MAINWKLKTYMIRSHSIFSLVDLQKKISNRTGVIISIQNLSNMTNKRPKQIRLETIELICSALNCKLSDILEVKPKEFSLNGNKQKLSYKNTPHAKRGVKAFPNPKDYL